MNKTSALYKCHDFLAKKKKKYKYSEKTILNKLFSHVNIGCESDYFEVFAPIKQYFYETT